MTSLAMEHLAKTNPAVSFVHAYPGLVGTNIYNNSFPKPVAAVYNYAMWPLMWPFSVDLKEAGERHLFHLASGKYPAREEISVEDDVATGITGEKGGGVYLLDWKGDVRSSAKILDKYREQDVAEVVWRHTEGLLEEAVRR